MGQILNLFFEYPSKEFHIRGIARQLSIPKSTVSYRINQLLKKKLIIKNKNGVFPSFTANESNDIYLFYKRQDAIMRVIESGLLDYIDGYREYRHFQLLLPAPGERN